MTLPRRDHATVAAIAVIGTLDTKGEALTYLGDLIRSHGHAVCVIDTSLRPQSTYAADITSSALLQAAGWSSDSEVSDGDIARAITAISDGLVIALCGLQDAGQLKGAVALGGGQGTMIAAPAMQRLNFGVPKLMVSTMASGQNTFEPYVGTADITLMHSVVDILGADPVSATILRNAAAAISGMADATPQCDRPASGIVVGATMLGPTTPCVIQARALLRSHDCDVVAFHANGTGGRCMDRMLSESALAGALDISTQEVVGYVCDGVFNGGPTRMTAAARAGLPQVVVPGGTDYVVRGPVDTLTAAQRSQPLVVHNARLTRIRTTVDEMSRVGDTMATRLNQSVGPATVLIPLQGFSHTDRPGGPFHDPPANQALIDRLESRVASHVTLTCIDAHINSAAFAEAAVGALRETLGHDR